MKTSLSLCKYLVGLCLFAFLAQAPVVLANEHGGGASGPTPLKFIVNLGDPSNGGRYLQVQMVFEGATPEVEHEIALFQPRIQHALILMLSAEDAATLMTLQGKKNLTANIIEKVNHELHQTVKTGVKDVFFTSFIIQ
jgi:flagellar FliL protein